ncbi:HIT family protein [Nocardia alni]|uniref:HIT family protein n=1 Tax=Nocardia alni TaxID=2815723 RepID=UPI001C247684|nr:HIT domain-containing protein [Nocardia alni]
MSSCIFCGIASGIAPATKIHDDEVLCAFLDIRPITRGHTLVIPKRHATNLDDLDSELGSELFGLGHRLAKALRRSDLGADGANLILNDGESAFQTVHHVHLHVVPRHSGDIRSFATGMLFRGRVGKQPDPRTTAAAIRGGLDRLAAEEDSPSDTPAAAGGTDAASPDHTTTADSPAATSTVDKEPRA